MVSRRSKSPKSHQTDSQQKSQRGTTATSSLDARLISLVSAASTTNRADVRDNEDSFAIAKNDRIGVRAVILADGLGSVNHAGRAANIVVQSVKRQIESLCDAKDISLESIFRSAQADLTEAAREFWEMHGETADSEGSFATTLMVALEDRENLRFAYVGNGAIWHLRGNFNHFPRTKYIPWNSLNYLNPHSVQNKQGREALYKLISLDNDPSRIVPTVLEVAKDQLYFGDVFMLCTDGIYSSDQVQVGKAPNESIWIRGEPKLITLYRHLDSYFMSPADPTEEALERALDDYLEALRNQSQISDDATLGVIVTRKALEYQEKYRTSQGVST